MDTYGNTKIINYANLHNHTQFSNCSCGFIDCMNKEDDLIKEAIKLGYSGIAITDHECLSAMVRVEQLMDKMKQDEKELNFKVVYGNEIYLAREDMSKDTYKSGDKFYHFML